MSQLAGAVAFLWAISMVRLAIAYEREEHLAFEPALAALLSVAPPIALLRRSIRDAVFDEIG